MEALRSLDSIKNPKHLEHVLHPSEALSIELSNVNGRIAEEFVKKIKTITNIWLLLSQAYAKFGGLYFIVKDILKIKDDDQRNSLLEKYIELATKVNDKPNIAGNIEKVTNRSDVGAKIQTIDALIKQLA